MLHTVHSIQYIDYIACDWRLFTRSRTAPCTRAQCVRWSFGFGFTLVPISFFLFKFDLRFLTMRSDHFFFLLCALFFTKIKSRFGPFIHSFHHSFASLVWLPIALYLSFNCSFSLSFSLSLCFSLSLALFVCFSASFPIAPCLSSLHQIQLPIQMICLVILFVLFCCHHCAAISFVCNFSLIGRLVPKPRIEPYSKSSSMSFDFFLFILSMQTI